jgi:hypothetical protein
MFPTKQGFYARVSHEWRPALGVPCLHLAAPHDKYAILMRDFCYVNRRGEPRVAKEGFPFNGISIPRPLWRVAGHPWGRNLPAATIHDFECAIAQSLPPGDERAALRLRADGEFRECLELIPNPSVVPPTWFCCVRIGSRAASRQKVTPDFRLDPESYYRSCGFTSDIVAMTLDGYTRRRGENDWTNTTIGG